MEPLKFDVGIEYQKSLLYLITKDPAFASVIIKHFKDHYFENEVLSWAYSYILKYQEKYNAIPNINVILEATKELSEDIREIYQITLDSVRESNIASAEWLKDKALDFIKRNIFVAAMAEAMEMYNGGGTIEAYDKMRTAMDEVSTTEWDTIDREWFFEDFNQRMSDRLSNDPLFDSIPTGIRELDMVLGGGLSASEVAIWIAYAKRGKTTILTNHGVQAVRRSLKRVLHIVLEGSKALVANRYDAIFAQEDYALVKTGQLNEKVYQSLLSEYRMLGKRLVIRGFTERWDYTVQDIYAEIQELKRIYNWDPELIIIDYADLLSSRGKHNTEEAKQRAAYQDVKTLAGKGYAIWTAAQAQRPKTDIEVDAQVLSYKNVADCYAKIQKVDFIGSINQTREEREAKQARLFAELYRDNEANRVIPVYADFSKMSIRDLRQQSFVQERQPVQGSYGLQQVKAPLG